MVTEKRLIDVNALMEYIDENHSYSGLPMAAYICTMELLQYAPTVDAYTEEQVDSIIKKVLKTENRELEQERDWLKNCLNCEIRNKCPRHCGKVVHDCDHWVYGDPVVHGRWEKVKQDLGDGIKTYRFGCSECGYLKNTLTGNYCPNCGAKMDGDNHG